MRLDEKETALVLAGLRLLEMNWDWKQPRAIPKPIWDIITETNLPIVRGDIGPLCEKINCESDTYDSTVLAEAMQAIWERTKAGVVADLVKKGGTVVDLGYEIHNMAEIALSESDESESDEPDPQLLVDALEEIRDATEPGFKVKKSVVHDIARKALARHKINTEGIDTRVRLFLESEPFGREYFDIDIDDIEGQLNRLTDETVIQAEIDGITRRVGWEIG